jgi:hypothetical protein
MVHPAPHRASSLGDGIMSIGVERLGSPPGLPQGIDHAASHGDGGFSALLAPVPAAATNAAANAAAAPGAPVAAAASPLSGVALLEAGIADALVRDARDKEARRHGRAMLQALGAVQLALLDGDGVQARSALAALATTAGDPRAAEDPVLRLIMREIAVRAAVELARSDAPVGAEGAADEDVSTA